MRLILLAASLLGVAAVLAVAAYACSNKSGHTGANPYWSYYLFLPLTLLGLVAFLRAREKKHAVMALAVGVVGMAYIFLLDSTNTLLEYRKWIQRGMPEKGNKSVMEESNDRDAYKLRSKRRVNLGTFTGTGAQLVVADPGYDLNTVRAGGLGVVLSNCQSGMWNAEVVIKDFESLPFPLTSELRVFHSTVANVAELKWEKQHGLIGTDYAQAGVYDLAHFHDHSLVPQDIKWTIGSSGPADPNDLWYSYCCELTCAKPEGSILPFGVVTISGKGDGGYQYSIARDITTGKIVGIWIVFVDDSGNG
jgi:hypothetical protein